MHVRGIDTIKIIPHENSKCSSPMLQSCMLRINLTRLAIIIVFKIHDRVIIACMKILVHMRPAGTTSTQRVMYYMIACTWLGTQHQLIWSDPYVCRCIGRQFHWLELKLMLLEQAKEKWISGKRKNLMYSCTKSKYNVHVKILLWLTIAKWM